ncbi:methyltransferase-like protein 7B [Podospora aff. communis PSN243]|uniref:Methyltransferase-like protein 7B n=1 Tax=Podospora aff. communis PSN243 TaxID=3040156 RepID=A0AAV9G9G9_9PEZI|nr:methyltransferase-like protein 7B [Podospora aff. communis PSN243]
MDDTPVPDLMLHCWGTVLQLHPRAGFEFHLFDTSRITRIVGVEPMWRFAHDLGRHIDQYQLGDIYQVLPTSCDDLDYLESAGLGPDSVDTVLSIHCLCSVPDPEATMRAMYRVLKPGGKFIFWEHHRSSDLVTELVQDLWNPIWTRVSGGCSLTTDVMAVVLAAGDWANVVIENDKKTFPFSVRPMTWGFLVKARERDRRQSRR